MRCHAEGNIIVTLQLVTCPTCSLHAYFHLKCCGDGLHLNSWITKQVFAKHMVVGGIKLL